MTVTYLQMSLLEEPIKKNSLTWQEKTFQLSDWYYEQHIKGNGAATHIQNILSQLRRFNAGEHSEKQVHDSRRADVFDHQVYKIHLLLQKIHNL